MAKFYACGSGQACNLQLTIIAWYKTKQLLKYSKNKTNKNIHNPTPPILAFLPLYTKYIKNIHI